MLPTLFWFRLRPLPKAGGVGGANDNASALRYFGQANDAYKADPGLSAAIFNGRGNALKELKRYNEAEAEILKALAIAREMKSPLLVALTLTNVASVRLMKGDLAAADRTIAEGMALTRSAEAGAYRPAFLALGAQAALEHGDLARAQTLIGERFNGTDLAKTILTDRPAHETAYRIYRKLGQDALALQHLAALKRLDDQARKLEPVATGPSFDAFVATERSQSAPLGGRSVFGWEAELPRGKAGSADS